MLGKKLITVVVCLHVIICSASAKKSVFIISSHNSNFAQAYSIEGNEVDYQADIDISSYYPNSSAVGNTVWPEKNLMFVTYEGSMGIVWSSTKTLHEVGQFTLPFYYPNSSIAGIVVNRSQGLIYFIVRNTGDLYAYSFDDNDNTLIEKGVWHLNTMDGYLQKGMGLALDEIQNLLYVTFQSNRVFVYDVNDFNSSNSSINPNGFIDIVVDGNDRPAVGIAVDPVRRFMYTAGYNEGSLHNYLVRTMLDATYTSTEILVGDEDEPGTAIGLGVDTDTGFVFCTTSLDDFRVYDSNLVLKYTFTNNIWGPAGVAVGGFYKFPYFIISKDNNDTDTNNSCVDPDVHKSVAFDIYWDLNGYSDTNTKVIDYLPRELDYNSSAPGPNDYNSSSRTVTWNVSGSSGHILLKANITKWADPGGTINNTVQIESDNYIAEANCEVNVCNWGSSIIYVDQKDVNGFNNGTSWNDAYTDLHVAIARVSDLSPAITAIWVASGTYQPINDTSPGYQNASFNLPNNVALIGHFGGIGTYETSPYQRNLADSNKETILEGQIGSDTSQTVYYVITAQNVSLGLIDGFTIKDSSSHLIYLNDVNALITNCKIINNYNANSPNDSIHDDNCSYADIHNCLFENNSNSSIYSDTSSGSDISYCVFDGNNSYGPNGSFGLYLTDYSGSNVNNSEFRNFGDSAICGFDATISITDCNIYNNSLYGVRGEGTYLTILKTAIANNAGYGLHLVNGSDLDIENSIIKKSGYQGIYLSYNRSSKIVNNWIHNNGTLNNFSNGSGIYFEYHSMIPIPIVRNNTICNNYSYGIECSQYGQDPCIINCIISGNDINDLYRPNGSFNRVNYCLLQHSHSGSGNKTGDPCFMNPSNSDDLHIAGTSQCKDAGDPNGSYDGETDIDGEPRVCYGRVDIGGDEYYWSKADYNKDGFVNFNDFAVFGSKWRAQDANISLGTDNYVDLDDLALFCNEWLWQAGWTQGLWMTDMSGEGDASMSMATVGMSSAETDVSQSQTGDTLILPDAASSFAAGSAKLQARVRRFYDIPQNTTSSVSSDDMNTNTDETASPLVLSTDMLTMVSEESTTIEQAAVEETADEQQQSMLAGEGQTAGIWLVYDGNMTPDYNDEITVYVHSDPLLLGMDIIIDISGDANITTAMSEADCNSFGWDNGWNSDPYIDPEGWLLISGVSWECTVNGTIGYFKFRYYSGEVNVSISGDSEAADANCETVLFSGQPLVFGYDPNDPNVQ